MNNTRNLGRYIDMCLISVQTNSSIYVKTLPWKCSIGYKQILFSQMNYGYHLSVRNLYYQSISIRYLDTFGNAAIIVAGFRFNIQRSLHKVTLGIQPLFVAICITNVCIKTKHHVLGKLYIF